MLSLFQSNLEARLKPGDLAPNVTVLNTEGEPVALDTTWQSGPVLLTFLRHFG